AAEREGAGGGDTDPKPSEGTGAHSRDDVRDLTAFGFAFCDYALQKTSDHLGVAERVGARCVGEAAAVSIYNSDGRSQRGVNGENHLSRVVGTAAISARRTPRSPRAA